MSAPNQRRQQLENVRDQVGTAPAALVLSRIEALPLLTSYRDLVVEIVGRLLETEISPEQQSRALMRQTEALLLGEQSPAALEIALALEQSAATLPAPQQDRLQLLIARSLLAQGKISEAAHRLDALPDALDEQIHAWRLAAVALTRLLQKRLSDASRGFQDALEALAGLPVGLDDLRYFCLLNCAVLGAPVDSALQAMSIAERHGAHAELVAAIAVAAPHYQASGDVDRAVTLWRQAIAAADAAQMATQAREFTTVLIRCLLDGGRLADARDETLAMLDRIEIATDFEGFFKASALMIDICIAAEEYPEAYQVYRTAHQTIGVHVPAADAYLRQKLELVKQRIGDDAYSQMVSDLHTIERAKTLLKH